MWLTAMEKGREFQLLQMMTNEMRERLGILVSQLPDNA
jgi:hypothetical protein